MKTKMVRLGAMAGLVALTAACGGSGGGGSSSGPIPIPPPASGGGLQWTAGVYAPASNYKNLCRVPRTGVDIEGNAFPDRQGTTDHENFWLRSWTNETYLWNDEVTDRDPRLYNDPVEYFDLLRTTAVTSSGEDKDDFHFSQSTEDFLEQRNSAPTASYGVSFQAFSNSPPRDYRVRYHDPNTPAAEVTVGGRANFFRGSRVLEVDGVDFVNGGDLDTINAGLFPATAGEVHEFLMRDPDGTERRVTLTSADLSRKAVNRVLIEPTPSGNVGYILFNTFSPFASEEEIVDAVNQLAAANVTDVVLDLRYNGGGLLAVASQLSYMLAGPAFTDGKYFEQLRFNDDAGNTNPVTGDRNDPIPFYDETLGFSTNAGQALPTLPDVNRVFILSTGRTCSASEAVINGLRGVDFDVILMGDITCGKPFGFYPQDNCGTTFYTIQFQGTNFKGFGDYADGFVPQDDTFPFGVRMDGCSIADDLDRQLGDPSEALFSAALHWRDTGTCPLTTTSASAARTVKESPDFDGSLAVRLPEEGIFETSRDMTLPERR